MRAGLFLLIAALLEASGDAFVRIALGQYAAASRIAFLAAGAAALTAYGMLVNLPGWDFGRLLGAYVAVFFITAQAINAVLFGRAPTLPIIAGGALIIAGGVVIAVWRAP